MPKDTSKIIEDLKICDDFKTFYNENSENLISVTLSEMLNKLMTEKNLKKSEIIKNSELADTYAYQILSGRRVPERKKLLCLAVGMGLNLEETQNLLKSAGFAPLYVKLPADSIIIYGICNRFSVVKINEMLFDYDLETIG